jgi:nitroreductase
MDAKSQSAIDVLLAAAIQAPSGDNTQPWRFVIDREQGQIALHLNETSDPSPMNAGQRMARIAIGAALENVIRTAEKNNWSLEYESAQPPALAVIRVPSVPDRTPVADETISARVTNRRLYDGRPLAPDVLNRLRFATPSLEGVRTHWIALEERKIEMGRLIGRGDALMLGESSMRLAFLNKVRFDRPAADVVEEGLSLASLELSASERLALRLMTWIPNWLLKFSGMKRVFAAKARKLVASSSGLCLIVAPDQALQTDLLVGRCLQRAWLALTAEGLSAQPMMPLIVLENVRDNESTDLIAVLGADRLTRLREELREAMPEIGEDRPAFLLRFGYAPAPGGRTGRLPIRTVTTESSLPCNSEVTNR